MGDLHPPRMGTMRHPTSYRPVFLAGVSFTITLAGHEPWDHHAPHEQAPEQVGVHAAPITCPTSGSFSFSEPSSTVVASGLSPLLFRV
jgi:hypothetical protein